MRHNTNFSIISKNPIIVELNNVLSDNEITEIVHKLSDRHWLAQNSIEVRLDETGISFELPVSILESLGKINSLWKNKLRINSEIQSIRIRDYHETNQHGLHCDHYEIDGKHLLFTTLLYLTTPESGGETRFPQAISNKGLLIKAEKNKLVMWLNYDSTGEENYLTEHEALSVQSGRKLVAIYLYYAPLEEVSKIEQELTKLIS